MRSDPVTPLWRGAQVLRLLSYLYALGFRIAIDDDLLHPGVTWVLFGLLTAWTVACGIAYYVGFGRNWYWVGAELVIACALMLSTSYVASESWALNNQTWPTTLWATNAVISVAILTGPVGGIVSGLIIGGTSTFVKGELNLDFGRNATIIVIVATGMAVGLAAANARRVQDQLSRAARIAAAAEERERLSREVHDGVLQVLALIDQLRRGDRPTGMDDAAFRAAYALLGAQRNLRIMGIFTRLCLRDGKPRYLDMMPRVWAAITRDLSHPALVPLAAALADAVPVVAGLDARPGHLDDEGLQGPGVVVGGDQGPVRQQGAGGVLLRAGQQERLRVARVPAGRDARQAGRGRRVHECVGEDLPGGHLVQPPVGQTRVDVAGDLLREHEVPVEGLGEVRVGRGEVHEQVEELREGRAGAAALPRQPEGGEAGLGEQAHGRMGRDGRVPPPGLVRGDPGEDGGEAGSEFCGVGGVGGGGRCGTVEDGSGHGRSFRGQVGRP